MVEVTAIVASTIPALITGKYIEAVLFYIFHDLVRKQFPKQYHHVVPSMCRLITASVMFFGTLMVFPVVWSIISVIPICYGVSLIGYIKKTADEYEIKCAKLYEQLHSKTNKDILLEKCSKLKVSQRDTEIAVRYYIERQTPKQIWEWLCNTNQNIEWDSVYQIIYRLGKKLNK